MRRWTIEVSERELRTILTAFDLARDETINPQWRWWFDTLHANALYEKLLEHGIVARQATST